MDDDRIDELLEGAEEALDRGDLAAAERLLTTLLAERRLHPGDEGDARYLLGIIREERRDAAGAIREWLRVLELDAACDATTPLLSEREFDDIARAALDELPQELLERLGNIPVLIEERPTPEQVRDGSDPRLLGVFSGLPMPFASVLGPSSGGVIQLYRRNLERVAAGRDDLAAQIRVTVLHETAHFFGADEDDLGRLGLR
jgi:predicted Zn-dependent protease with MMP-like domain